MTKITDQQFESILLRLESGESLPSVQADFPHLEEDIAALQDLQDFFAAQRLRAKPDPDGLHGVLRQLKAQADVAQGDDDFGWGSWFAPWRRSLSVALPALVLLSGAGLWWQNEIPVSVVNAPAVESEIAVADSAAPMARMAMAPESAEVMDMGTLAESLSAEFAADMAEFETTRDELEPLFSQQLFSYNPDTTL